MPSRFLFVDLQFTGAISDGDVKTVRYHLSTYGIKPELNKVYDGSTHLTHACTMANPQIVEMLLEAGAQPWVTDGHGLTPMTYALMAENPVARLRMVHAIGKSLLSHNRSPIGLSAPDTPLEGFAQSYWGEVLPYHGCNDLQFIAFHYNDAHLIKLLWSFQWQFTMRRLQANNPGFDMMSLLPLCETALDQVRDSGVSGHGNALFMAALNGRTEVARALMFSGFKNKAQTGYEMTPQEVASERGEELTARTIHRLDAEPLLSQYGAQHQSSEWHKGAPLENKPAHIARLG